MGLVNEKIYDLRGELWDEIDKKHPNAGVFAISFEKVGPTEVEAVTSINCRAGFMLDVMVKHCLKNPEHAALIHEVSTRLEERVRFKDSESQYKVLIEEEDGCRQINVNLTNRQYEGVQKLCEASEGTLSIDLR